MAHYESHPPHLHWPHRGFMAGLDWRSVRRGREVFEQVLAPCHSLNYMKFRHFEAFMSKDEIKEWAASIEVADVPDETGQERMRPAKRFDALPSPYKNEQAARFANSGALPPDLSLIVNARHGGVDYIYHLLTSYGRQVPCGINLTPGQFFNPYFPGGVIGMPPPLSDDMIEYEDGTPASVHQMAKDIACFLEFCSNPWWDERKLVGCKWLGTVAALGITASWYNRFATGYLRARRVAYRAVKYAAK